MPFGRFHVCTSGAFKVGSLVFGLIQYGEEQVSCRISKFCTLVCTLGNVEKSSSCRAAGEESLE